MKAAFIGRNALAWVQSHTLKKICLQLLILKLYTSLVSQSFSLDKIYYIISRATLCSQTTPTRSWTFYDLVPTRARMWGLPCERCTPSTRLNSTLYPRKKGPSHSPCAFMFLFLSYQKQLPSLRETIFLSVMQIWLWLIIKIKLSTLNIIISNIEL